MKKLLLLLIPIIICSSNAPSPAKPEKTLKKAGYVFVPSGATLVDGKEVTVNRFYISAGEITNEQYREFLDSVKASGDSAAFKAADVQKEKWLLPYSSMESISELYFTHPAYDHYPVVNITQEAATMYCIWLQQQLQNKGVQCKVRLPEKAEWVIAARGGHVANKYAWEGNEVRNKRGIYLANYKTEHSAEDGGYLTTISKSYWPNDYGIYNMCGNVSEWLSNAGACIGGNWNSPLEFISIDAAAEFPYSTAASPFIGFRPVISVAN